MTFDETLQNFRRDIDAVDERLFALIRERTAIVRKVGTLKNGEAPGRCPIRPGREAQQLRRVAEAFRGQDFGPAFATDVWRTLIMGSLMVEGEVKISVCAPDANRDLFWLAREYFSPYADYTRQPTPKRVIGDIIDGKAQVGVVPLLDEMDHRWWQEVIGTGQEKPQIFACLPFVYLQKPARGMPAALAVGRITPEETGNDVSYIVIDAEETMSQHRLQVAFSAAGMTPRWIEIFAGIPGKRIHVIALRGFITAEHKGYQQLAENLGSAIITTHFLGAHAAPVELFTE